MASDLEFVEYVCDQMRDAGAVRYRKMFGEFALYCDDKVVALVCDDRLYVKPTAGGREFIGELVEAPPYPSAKPHLLVEDRLDSREWLSALIIVTARELPAPRPKKRRSAQVGPLRVTVILAHPDRESFNHAIADAAVDALSASGHDVVFHDLCAERFDPVMPAAEIPQGAKLPEAIATHCLEIENADGIVVVHPNWWRQPPAILKGWVDRVMRPGVAYRFNEGDSGEGVPEGLLRARTALVLNTSNTSDERERAVFGDPLRRIWVDCVFGLCGVTDVRRRVFSEVVTSTPAQRDAWLAETRALVSSCFPA